LSGGKAQREGCRTIAAVPLKPWMRTLTLSWYVSLQGVRPSKQQRRATHPTLEGQRFSRIPPRLLSEKEEIHESEKHFAPAAVM